MNLWLWAGLPIFLILAWIYTAAAVSSFPTLRNKRILLLIAHPDDEAMFFAPAVQALTHRSLNNRLKILCMSTGNADGLGETRRKELEKSAALLGCGGEGDVLCLNDPNFLDGPTTWNPTLLSATLTQLFAPNLSTASAKAAPPINIDALLTFDHSGVSNHPNHRSLAWAAETWLRGIMHRHAGWENPVALYQLTSVSILRKYVGALDAVYTLLSTTLHVLAEQVLGQRDAAGKRVRRAGKERKAEMRERPSALVFVSGPWAWRRAQRAMYAAHRSQMVWFRWGWIGVGRYMVVNDLRRVMI